MSLMIREKMKRRSHSENEESEDRLSDLPDCLLVYILSFLRIEYAVRTCILSTRWKHLWKRIPELFLHSSTLFRGKEKQFFTFVSKILTLRDNSAALHILDFECDSDYESELVQKILNYACSHNTQIQQLGISISHDSDLLMPCVSSCQALTSLTLSIYNGCIFPDTFPKYLNMPALTSLDLTGFTFCGDENRCAEPFSAFTKLNSLIISRCMVKDAQILRISSETLDNLYLYKNLFNFDKIELAAPSLCTFTFYGTPKQKICGSGFSSVKEVNIDAHMFSKVDKSPMILFSWLLDLANIESLTVSSSTLQILSLVPDLLEVKLPSLCNLKSVEIKLERLGILPSLLHFMYEANQAMLKKAAAKSRKEASKLRKAFKAGLEPPSIPDGIVDFLLQNSPSAKVNITSDY
ncbi:putative F-box domain, leucine-rich repeat domain, L domain-containing protein [Medicago truncatula]|uniref:Putative F-box domain, leucine-rich repeat domain, L domain-containing protein n=1 Tax=Medicago truncatula TaxID=3880 RepID=A0A396HMA5_MEDTR|nr:putative F-box/FBD/LRR-repeat protein At1g78760 isoform X3 [Medicago truncatula]RHN53024.1 putative F-box domain, leucine-rich repeat domain, L domain-containing protein [Medicago truncatula]